MSKSCLCIGGPKDGQWIAVEDRFTRGDNYRVVLAPKLDMPRFMDEATDDDLVQVQYDSCIYTIDVVRLETADWWYMRPYGQTIAHSIAMLFRHYKPPQHEAA